MPLAKLGLYSHFEFFGEEERIAQTFSLLNKAFLQNRRYELVLQRDKLVPDFTHLEDYLYEKVQLDGRIDQLTELIDFVPDGTEQQA